jgi:hypothetical protein
MSKRRSTAGKLFVALGGAGLALSICVPQATAVPPFSNTNYSGRYICNVSSAGNSFTAIMRLVPNGSGAYSGGTLVAPGSAFFAFDPAAPPEDNSCSYSLVMPSSSYLVGSNGLATEVLTWKAVAGNNPVCPATPGSFIMSQEIVLRANVNANGKVQSTSISSGNLLDQGVGVSLPTADVAAPDPGDGYCFK